MAKDVFLVSKCFQKLNKKPYKIQQNKTLSVLASEPLLLLQSIKELD